MAPVEALKVFIMRRIEIIKDGYTTVNMLLKRRQPLHCTLIGVIITMTRTIWPPYHCRLLIKVMAASREANDDAIYQHQHMSNQQA